MIRKALGWLLELLAGLLDREIDPQKIREYIEGKYSSLQDRSDLGKTVEKDLADLRRTMIELGWLSGGQPLYEDVAKSEFQAETGWFGRQGLTPGAGQELDRLDSQGESRQVSEILEKLLRHVEVKREKSLGKFTQSLTPAQAWLERCNVSILFSRAARRHHDLRFLNAALKMNEWYFQKIGNSRSPEITTRYLLALAEQELSAKELLTC